MRGYRLFFFKCLLSIVLFVCVEGVSASNPGIRLPKPHYSAHSKTGQSKEVPPGNVWDRIRSSAGFFAEMPSLSGPLASVRRSDDVRPAQPVLAMHDYRYKRLGFRAQTKPPAETNTEQRLPPSTVVNLPKPKINIASKVVVKQEPVQGRFHTRILLQQNKVDVVINAPSGHLDKQEDKTKQAIIPALGQGGDLQKLAQSADKQRQAGQRISQHLAWYAQRGGFLTQVAGRAAPYLYHVVDALRRNSLPEALALLPIVESAYQADAQSPKSAAGIWQFVPATGLEYGLQQTQDYDERFDVLESTQAAARYLAFLAARYHGDWLLALAAYNCGPGTVDEAVQKNKAEGLDGDFWSLNLPEETQEYVPRFLALAHVFARPATYGIEVGVVRDEPHLIRAMVDSQYLAGKGLEEVARLAGLDSGLFNQLNSAYRQAKLAVHGPYHFVMPVENANQMHKRLSAIAQFVAETIPIAKRQSGTMTTKNPLDWEALTYMPVMGETWLLLEAKQSVNVKAATDANVSDGFTNIHYVEKGETLPLIARNYGLKLDALCAANRFKPNQKLAWGQRLVIPVVKAFG